MAYAGSLDKVVAFPSSPTKLNSSLHLRYVNLFFKSMLCFICMQ